MFNEYCNENIFVDIIPDIDEIQYWNGKKKKYMEMTQQQQQQQKGREHWQIDRQHN